MRIRRNRKKFERYVKKLEDATPFHTRGGIIFYRRFSDKCRKMIREKLERVDPEGLKKMMNMTHRGDLRKKRPKQLDFVKSEGPPEDLVALSKEVVGMEGVKRIRFMHLGGLKNILAICLAAGYHPDEVAAMAKMDISDLNSLVTKEDVKAAMTGMPEAIALAADQLVMRDLITGKATEETGRADMIATRRRKTVLDASAEGRELRREDEELEGRREKHLKDRFGVDRQKGKVIDVKAEESK